MEQQIVASLGQFFVQLPFVGVTIWLVLRFVSMMQAERDKADERREAREERDEARDEREKATAVAFAKALDNNARALDQLRDAINANVVQFRINHRGAPPT